MPKDKAEAAIKRASGATLPFISRSSTRATRRTASPCSWRPRPDNPTRTVAGVRNLISKNGGNLATNGSVSFLFKKMGVFRLAPAGIDSDELELYLIDHGLEEMGESTSDKGEPELVIRCAFADFGKLQGSARGAPHHARSPPSMEYVCSQPVELPEEEATECSS